LFEVIVDRLRAVAKRYQTRIPLYVMTSPATTAATRRFFAQKGYLGLPPEDLRFFEQGTLPAIDAASGKVLLEKRDSIARAPDGHGGMLAALARHVGFGELRRRGVEVLFYGQIDNPLLTVCDSEFLGYHLLAQSDATTQVVRKSDPAERVGVVAQVDGRLEIIEYSDLSPAVAKRRRADGTLELWAGNTAVHAFGTAFLERMSLEKNSLPLHFARKKVPFLNDLGQLVEPSEPNAIKFERFIFDLLPRAQNALVVEVNRATAFAPVKNASGAPSDTPEAAQEAMLAYDRALLTAAGVTAAPGVKVEIHPGFALDAEELRARLQAGHNITADSYLV
jgi:UDP-N-acetylglucosamine/UDP-N-acetylgalactosamine diphosphorylase